MYRERDRDECAMNQWTAYICIRMLWRPQKKINLLIKFILIYRLWFRFLRFLYEISSLIMDKKLLKQFQHPLHGNERHSAADYVYDKLQNQSYTNCVHGYKFLINLILNCNCCITICKWQKNVLNVHIVN